MVDVPQGRAELSPARAEAPEDNHALRQGPSEHRARPSPIRRTFERRMGIFLPFGDHLNAEREGKRRKPCRIWADGGSATIRSKSVWKIRLERMAGNPATCGYSDGIPFAHFLSTKKPLTFPTSGRSGGEGVHFSIEWALGEMEPLIFSNGWASDGPGRPDGPMSGRPGRPRR